MPASVKNVYITVFVADEWQSKLRERVQNTTGGGGGSGFGGFFCFFLSSFVMFVFSFLGVGGFKSCLPPRRGTSHSSLCLAFLP